MEPKTSRPRESKACPRKHFRVSRDPACETGRVPFENTGRTEMARKSPLQASGTCPPEAHKVAVSVRSAAIFTNAFGTNELARTYSGTLEPSALRSEQ